MGHTKDRIIYHCTLGECREEAAPRKKKSGYGDGRTSTEGTEGYNPHRTGKKNRTSCWCMPKFDKKKQQDDEKSFTVAMRQE